MVFVLAGTAVVSLTTESKSAGRHVPRVPGSIMAQMAADPPRRLTAEEKAVVDAELAAKVEMESTEVGGLRKLQNSDTFWYVEKKCGETLQNFCLETGICGRGEGVALNTCIPMKAIDSTQPGYAGMNPNGFPQSYQSAKWSLDDPVNDLVGYYEISVKFWDNGNCAGSHDGSWPTSNNAGNGDFLFDQCDEGRWRKRVNGKPWEEFQLSEIQNLDATCDTPRFFSGYDLLETCLKEDLQHPEYQLAGRYATCTDSSYVQYYNAADPTCQDTKVVLESHVTNVCTPEVGNNIQPIIGELIQPLGLTYTGEELMYYCEDLFSQEDEALTNVETAVAAVSAFFFFLLCFNIYYFCLRPEQDDDEAEAQYYAEKAMFEKTSALKKNGEEETELGSAGFNPIQAPKKVRTPPCLTTMLSSKGDSTAPPPPPPPPPGRSTAGPQDVLPGIRFENE